MKTSDSTMILITINWWLADENDHIEVENFIQAFLHPKKRVLQTKYKNEHETQQKIL